MLPLIQMLLIQLKLPKIQTLLIQLKLLLTQMLLIQLKPLKIQKLLKQQLNNSGCDNPSTVKYPGVLQMMYSRVFFVFFIPLIHSIYFSILLYSVASDIPS